MSATGKRRSVWGGAAACAVVGLLYVALRWAPGVGGAAPAPSPTPAAEAWTGDVAAEGRVVAYPGREIVVSATRAGLLERVLVSERDVVPRGALLAELDSAELRATLAEAGAEVREHEADTRLAEVELKRKSELAEQGVLSRAELDRAQRDLDSNLARLETARATLARVEAQLRLTRVLAPISGTVLSLRSHAGETVEVGTPVLVLADLGRLRVEAETDESDIARLEVGAPAVVTCIAYPGRAWRGHVEEVPDQVTLRRLKFQDPTRPTDTRVVAVKVAFDEPHPLRLGTTVDLLVRQGTAAPPDAGRTRGEQARSGATQATP